MDNGERFHHGFKPDALRPWSNEDIQTIRKCPRPHDDLFIFAETIPYWFQLMKSAPAVAFLVARCWKFDALPEAEAVVRIRKYVRMKRIDICAAMGFPESPRTVRLLSRISTNSGSLIQELLILRELMRWEPATYDILEKLSSVRLEDLIQLSVGVKSTHSGASWFPLLRTQWFFRLPAVKRYWLASNYDRIVRDDAVNDAFMGPVKSLACFRNERSAVSYITNFRRRAHTIRRAAEQLKKRINGFTWPEPPIPEIDSIVPILSNEALENESQNLRRSVATYAQRILLGEYYVYKMEVPFRYSLGIKCVDGSWEIDQMNGERSEEPVDPSLLKMINDWLDSAPRSPRDTSSRRDYLQAISKITGFPVRRRR